MADKVLGAITDSIAESLADGKKGKCERHNAAKAHRTHPPLFFLSVSCTHVFVYPPFLPSTHPPTHPPHPTVSLVGFGSFGTSVRSARTARNPRTGEPIEVPETTVATFAPSKVLKDKINHRTPTK